VAAELSLKLGISVSPRTVRSYWPSGCDPTREKRTGSQRSNVTAHPTAEWALQQFREAIPSEHAYRFLIRDRDSIFSEEVDRDLKGIWFENSAHTDKSAESKRLL
jgi:hypothetical protein